MSRGDREATALSAARLPTAAGSSSSRPAANASAKPLPPSGPDTTVVTEACEDGAQQNWPSVLAIATSLASVSYAPAAVKPSGHISDELRDGLGAFGGRGLGRRLVERVVLGRRRRRREPREQRVGRDDGRHLERALGRPPRALGGEVVRRRDADAALGDDADADPRVLAVGALVDRARGEPREPAPLVHEQDLDAVRARQAQGRLGDAADLVRPDETRHRPAPAAFIPPARISRAPRPARSGTARATRRGRRARPGPAGPCRSSACPTASSPRGRRPRRTNPRTRW